MDRFSMYTRSEKEKENRLYVSNSKRSIESETCQQFHKSDSENDVHFYEELDPPEIVGD